MTKPIEIMIHERVFEGLMRGEIHNERQWWGVKPYRYKIMSDGSLVYETLPPEGSQQIGYGG